MHSHRFLLIPYIHTTLIRIFSFCLLAFFVYLFGPYFIFRYSNIIYILKHSNQTICYSFKWKRKGETWVCSVYIGGLISYFSSCWDRIWNEGVWERKSLLGLGPSDTVCRTRGGVEGAPWDVWSHCICSREAEKMKAGTQFTLSLFCSSGPESMGWYHWHLGWVFQLQL